MRMSSCARAYVKSDCNTCNGFYTDLKGSKPIFADEFQGQVLSLIVRPGCKLTIYDEEDHEGDSNEYQGIVEVN